MIHVTNVLLDFEHGVVIIIGRIVSKHFSQLCVVRRQRLSELMGNADLHPVSIRVLLHYFNYFSFLLRTQCDF